MGKINCWPRLVSGSPNAMRVIDVLVLDPSLREKWSATASAQPPQLLAHRSFDLRVERGDFGITICIANTAEVDWIDADQCLGP
jgi:hypothetical protein